MRKTVLIFSFLVAICLNSYTVKAQDLNENGGFMAVGVNYGLAIPFADLKDRYGHNFQASLSLDIFNPKLKGFYGIEGSFHFGDQVKEDILAPLRSEQGAILGFNGSASDVFLRRRGAYLGIYLNRTIIATKNNPSSGLNFGLGVGILQHHIKIQDDSNNATQFNNDYEKGYDRSTRGPALKQNLVYQHIGVKTNYSIGIGLTEGFTQSVRAIDFDTRQINHSKRLDMYLSLDVKWLLPIFRFSEPDEIFY